MLLALIHEPRFFLSKTYHSRDKFDHIEIVLFEEL